MKISRRVRIFGAVSIVGVVAALLPVTGAQATSAECIFNPSACNTFPQPTVSPQGGKPAPTTTICVTPRCQVVGGAGNTLVLDPGTSGANAPTTAAPGAATTRATATTAPTGATTTRATATTRGSGTKSGSSRTTPSGEEVSPGTETPLETLPASPVATDEEAGGIPAWGVVLLILAALGAGGGTFMFLRRRNP